MGFYEVSMRVIPVRNVDDLMKFPAKELEAYGRRLGVIYKKRPAKEVLALAIYRSGKATLCASLGD